MKLVNFLKKSQCTGCCACYNVCKVTAITMDADNEGFIYPNINGSICTKCGLCIKVCPVFNALDISEEYPFPDIFASWNLDHDTRIASTSGGLFSAIATFVFEQGGYVVGARYNDKHMVEHYITHTLSELELIRQSKYVQSTIGNIFSDIKNILNDGNIVLFCGTPCQNAGLQIFLGKDYNNLYCCDFICRGVNSPKAYEKYLSFLQLRYSSDIEKVWFRNKRNGWNQSGIKISFKNGELYFPDRTNDPFMKGYLQFNLYCRPSCHECNFKGLKRITDITLGDFWGIGSKSKKLDDNNGTSVVMIHTQKGRNLFESIKDRLFYEKRCIEDVLDSGQCLMSSIKRGGNRERFFKNIDRYTFDQLLDKYGKYTFKERLYFFIRKIYNKLGLNIIKKRIINLFGSR